MFLPTPKRYGAAMSRDEMVGELDDIYDKLSAANHRDAPNLRGLLVRFRASKFYRPAPVGASSSEPETRELIAFLHTARLVCRTAKIPHEV